MPEACGHLRIDKAGRDGVYGYIQWADLASKRSSEPHHSGFGGAIDRKPAVTGKADDRGDIDDTPTPPGHHRSHGVFGQYQRREGIELDGPFDLRVMHRGQNAVAPDSSIVY